MFTGSMMKLKSILYGTLPFYYTKVFEPSSPKLAYYDYYMGRYLFTIPRCLSPLLLN